MFRKIAMLGLAPLGLLTGAGVANANINQQCPYEVMDWDVDQELIDELCEEWRRSLPPPVRSCDPKTTCPFSPLPPPGDYHPL